jgi:hypothetical protein
MLKVTANLHFPNYGIEILSKERDPDLQRSPSRMNIAGAKIREAHLEQEDSVSLKTRVKDPKAMAVVCLRGAVIARTSIKSMD